MAVGRRMSGTAVKLVTILLAGAARVVPACYRERAKL